MNKNEILEKSRKENKNKDIAELEMVQKASSIAYYVGLAICCALCFAQMTVLHTVNWGCWVVNFGILGTVFLVKYIKLRKKHELIFTVLYFAICAFFLIGFIMSLRG